MWCSPKTPRTRRQALEVRNGDAWNVVADATFLSVVQKEKDLNPITSDFTRHVGIAATHPVTLQYMLEKKRRGGEKWVGIESLFLNTIWIVSHPSPWSDC